MRNLVLAFGILIVFAGVLVSSWSNSSEEFSDFREISKVMDTLEVSGNFGEGEKLYVDWEKPSIDDTGTTPIPEPDPIYYISVLAPPPENGETNFTVILFRRGGANVTVSNSSGGFSSFFTGSTFPGGITQYSGEYVVLMDESARMYYGGSTPYSIRLQTEVVTTEYPHRDVLPIGITLIVVGIPLVAWAAKS